MPQRPFCSPFCSCLFRNLLPGRLVGLLSMAFLFLGMGVGMAQPVVGSNTEAATCNNSNGHMVITITETPPDPPYTVTLTGGSLTTPLILTTNVDTLRIDNLPGGNYFAVATDAAGKSSSSTFVQIGDLVAPTIIGMDPISATCLNNDGQIVVYLSGGGATPYTFLYNGQTVGKGSDLVSDTAKGLPSGSVTLVVQDHNGCTTSGGMVVPYTDDLTFSVPPGYTICQGTDTTIKVTTNATAFNWRPATGLSSAKVQDPIASPATTTTYTVVATRGICSTFGVVTVLVLPAPVADAGGPVDTTCYGKSVQLQGSGGVKYLWSPVTGLNNATISDPLVESPISSITYSLNVVDGNGCHSLSPSKILVYVRAPYHVFAGNDTSVMVGQAVPLDAVDVGRVGFNAYAWTPSSGLSNPFAADPTASFSAIGEYTYAVTATAPDGCTAADSITIKVYALADIFVPSAFTPNHDGHNDVLRALPVSMRDFKYLSVFNRWGQQVFTTTNPGIGWDGTFNGQEMPTGTYVWMAGGVDYMGRVVERKGVVVLVR